MLGDAARLASDDIGPAQRIEQRRFAVIDMTHDCHHRWPGLLVMIFIGIADHADFDVGIGHAFDIVTEFGNQQFGGVLVQRFIDGRHHAHPEQRFDQIGCPFRHPV